MSGAAVLRAEAVSRRYGATLALDAVDFEVRAGEVAAVIGGNGAGKSTLMKILAGAEQPTAGRVLVDGREARFGSVRDAEDAGIVLLPQELSVLENLTVADNVFLGRERGGLVDRAAEERAAADLLAELGQGEISPRARVSTLGAGARQMVALARALAARARVLVLDEPTAALGARETETLLEVVRELRGRGVAVVLISHRLEELLAVADRVTVLRDGRRVAEAEAVGVDERWIVRHMAGGEPPAAPPRAPAAAAAGEPLLRVEDAAGPLSLRAGEVVGLYGLLGAGRTELLERIAGLRPGGRVLVEGRPVASSVASRLRAGIALVPEDRRAAGLVPERSVSENITLANLHRCRRGFWISRRREREPVLRAVRALALRPPDPDRAAGTLSGGNQQKVVIGRALFARPRVLLLDEPTRGIDVNARAEIHALVREVAAGGAAVLVASSDADELRLLADRVLVLARGRVATAFAAPVGKEALVAAAAGVEGGGADA